MNNGMNDVGPAGMADQQRNGEAAAGGGGARTGGPAAGRVSTGPGGEGWRTVVLVGAVALGMFSFGHYWARESRPHPAVSDARDSGKEPMMAAGGGEPTMAATQPATGGGKPLWTCSMHPQVIQAMPGVCPICHMELTPLRASGGDGSNTVVVESAVVQNMGVRTATVAKGPLIQSVRVVGYLEEPEPFHHDINLRVSGWIEKLYANVDGMAITKGQPLFDLYSPELTVAIDEMISARKQTEAAPADDTARMLLDAARRKLSQYGLGDEQIAELMKLEAAPRTVPVLATMGGHLTAKMVYEGAAVKAGDLVLRLASRHRMWIDAQVYEQQLPLISDGQPVMATLVSQPGKSFAGRVLFVHPHLDPQTRTATVRIEIPNEDHSLRQGMYATVEILADAYREAIVVPREAVIDTGRRQVAFVALGGGRFEPRELTLGLPGQDGTVQVVSGLKAGETVVTSGQFLLDSESRLREAIAKFSSPAEMAEPMTDAPMAAPAATKGGDGQEEAGRMQDAMMPGETAGAMKASAPVPHTDDIVRAYLELSRKLGARQAAPVPLDPGGLVGVATMAAGHASAEGRPVVQQVVDAANALRGKTLAQQREAFQGLSDAVVALVQRSKPSPVVGEKLYVMHCPMAFDEKGADWIQDSETVANPYYPVEMKRCGSVRETIHLDK